MPTAKVKGGSSSHRYRPASEYDESTLAQKREYWRNKKREQRARLSEHRGKPSQESPPKAPPLIRTEGSCAVQGFFNASPCSNGKEPFDSAHEAQTSRWSNSSDPSRVLPQLSTSFSSPTKADGCDITAASPPSPGTRALCSAQSDDTPHISRSLVPLVRLTRVSNGSSLNTEPTSPSMQDTSLLKAQESAQTAIPSGSLFAASSTCPVSAKAEARASNSTPQCGKWSALVSTQGVKRVANAPASSETEEERVAKRREHWRIKKREQRAKQPARLAKAQERAPGTEATRQGLKTVGPRLLLPSQVFVTKGNQRSNLCKASVTSFRRIVEPQRKLPCYGAGGIPRGKTTRQRAIDAQKILMHQINLKCKSLMLSSGSGMPKIDPNDTPEQIIAKRREYWRIKKREQRAKLSMDMKVRLKEKDSLMRRVKRYQKIREDMRKARTAMHIAADPLAPSETIGGFIEEDGTLRMNVHSSPSSPTGRKVPPIQPHCKHDNSPPIRIPCPPSSLQPLQVRVSVPLAERFTQKPHTLLSTPPPTESTAAPPAHPQEVTQLTLSHPKTLQNTPSGGSQPGSNVGGCVMKMAVTSHAPSLALTLDPGLTEEEKMARRREYWRIKKREQRAIQALRLKQGLMHMRSKAQTLAGGRSESVGTPHTLPDMPALPCINLIKRESECEPTTDCSTRAEQTILPDVKPPLGTSPPEPDPAQSTDSQTATLLAVASMKKLLEESLSTVNEHRSESNIKTEVLGDASECDAESESPRVVSEKEDVPAVPTELTLLPEDSDMSEPVQFPGPPLNHSPLTFETPPPLHHSADVDQHPACDEPSHLSALPSLEPCEALSSSPKTQTPQSCRSPDSLNPHPPPGTDRTQQLHQHDFSDASQDNSSAVMGSEWELKDLCALSRQQRKREYWKRNKRRQRARRKAQQKDREEESSSELSDKDLQVPDPLSARGKGSVAALSVVSNIPTVLVVRPPQAGQQPPGTVRLQLPVSIVEESPTKARQHSSGSPKSPQFSLNWSQADSAPSFPTLRPPENPLASINMQPIEPCHSPEHKVGLTSSHLQSHAHPSQQPPVHILVPPKPLYGESKDDFLKRKREYWRLKKKDQRAKMAARRKRVASKSKPLSSWGTQDNTWGNSSEQPEHLLSVSTEGEAVSYPYSDYTPVEDSVWRNTYLMDYDPLNQLLVCMVCGELQYSHSLDGVRAHIDEAHPHTLTLEAEEKARVMQSWDEQVSQRERFFTSQLQQHSDAITDSRELS